MNRALNTLSLLFAAAIAGLSLGAVASPAWGQEYYSDPDTAVGAGRDALSPTFSDYPWYDSNADSIRRLDIEPQKTKQKPQQRQQIQPSTTPYRAPGGGSDLLRILGWVALAVLLALIALLLIRYFLEYESGEPATSSPTVTISSDVERVEDLPLDVRPKTGNFRDEALRLAREGNYARAIVFLYSHQLLQLDKQHVIRLTRGKTNRQYLREANRHEGLGGLLSRSMTAFEDSFFGGHSLDRERFENCWQDTQQMERHLATQPALAR